MMKKNILLSLALILTASPTFAEDAAGSFLRLKSGINSPQENGDVTHFTPIAFDAIYRLSSAFGIGLHGMYSSGSHAVTTLQGSNLAGFTLSKKMTLALTSGNYFFDFGSARVGAGIKAGSLFYSDSTTLASGLLSTPVPAGNSKTLFTAGPSLDIDLPLKGATFVSVGGDYMISQNHYHFASLYVGLGLNL